MIIQSLRNICFDRIYIKVFDQLELGIIPDSLELQNYFRPIDNNFGYMEIGLF
jgi:hypothetical protein